MKDIIKITGIIFIGIFIAVFLYPFLHEAGHMLAAFAVGADIKEFNLYPTPSILCNVDITNTWSTTLIGFSGILLPFVLVAIVQPKGFWNWYIFFILREICLLSIFISLASIIMFYNGIVIADDDITKILMTNPSNGLLYALILILLLIWLCILIAKSHPIQKILKYFNVM